MDDAKYQVPVQQADEIKRLRLAHEAEALENERLKVLLQTGQYVKSESEDAQPGPPVHFDSVPLSSPVPNFPSVQQPGTLERGTAIPDALAIQSSPPSTPKKSSADKVGRKPMGAKSLAKLQSSTYQVLESWTSNMTQQNALNLIARSGNNVRIISKPKSSPRRKRKSKAVMSPTQPLETLTLNPPEPKLPSTPQNPLVKRFNGGAFFASPLRNHGYTMPFSPQQSLDTWNTTSSNLELPMTPTRSTAKSFKDNTSFITPSKNDGLTSAISLKLESSPSYKFSYTTSPNHYASFSANSSFSSTNSHYGNFNDSPIATTDLPDPPMLDSFGCQTLDFSGSLNQNYTTTPTSVSTNNAASNMTGSANGLYQLPWATTPQNFGPSIYDMEAEYSCASATVVSGVASEYIGDMGGVGLEEGFTSSHGLNLGNESLLGYST